MYVGRGEGEPALGLLWFDLPLQSSEWVAGLWLCKDRGGPRVCMGVAKLLVAGLKTCPDCPPLSSEQARLRKVGIE